MAVGTASGFGLAIAAPSVLIWVFISVEAPGLPFNFGAVNVPAFLLIIPMTFIFTPFGAKVAHRMDAKPLKRLFGIFLLVVASKVSKSLKSLSRTLSVIFLMTLAAYLLPGGTDLCYP